MKIPTIKTIKIRLILALMAAALCGEAQAAPFVEVEAHQNRVRVANDGKMHFVLIQGDYKNNGARAMMRERLPSVLNKNQWVYYRFGVEIGSRWPVHKDQDALIVQWRNGHGGPYFAIHLNGDRFYVRQASNPVKKYFYKTKRYHPNEFLVKAIWSEGQNGRLIVSINGQTILQYSGRTLNRNKVRPYVSFGLYRPQWNGKPFNLRNWLGLTFTHFDFGRL